MKIVVANLKMNILAPLEREKYFESFKKEMKKKKIGSPEVVFCPPSVHVENFVKKIKSKHVSVGAQNVFWEDHGPYTGEISAPMLKNLGAEYVILGHSDRRTYFFENDKSINMKIISALKNGLKIILCIGENGEQKKNGTGEVAISMQFDGCLKNVNSAKIENIIICYEPVWAISSNNPTHPPTVNEIMSAKLLIKKLLVEKYGMKVAEKIKIIYGGSVDSDNVTQTCIEPGMDGALVGKESLTPHKFVKLIGKIDKN